MVAIVPFISSVVSRLASFFASSKLSALGEPDVVVHSDLHAVKTGLVQPVHSYFGIVDGEISAQPSLHHEAEAAELLIISVQPHNE